jgi:hypothetical protein
MRSASAAFYLISFFGFGGGETVNFDNLKPESIPPHWTPTETHRGPAPRWEIAHDKTAPSHQSVFAQVSRDGSDYEFPLAIYDKVICRDGELSVKFKITGGRKVKTAGIVWRYQDQNNYYLLHFSADEHNIVLFRVENGEARAVPVLGAKAGSFGVSHDVRENEWYVAKVIYRGTQIRVLFGNRLLFDAVDASLVRQGKTGLWTKAATLAEFDDFKINRKN